jgi:uncharacterized protein
MGRLVQLLLLIALAVIVWRLVRRALARPAPPGEAAPRFEPMARCNRCGTHVPSAQLDAAGACARCRA